MMHQAGRGFPNNAAAVAAAANMRRMNQQQQQHMSNTGKNQHAKQAVEALERMKTFLFVSNIEIVNDNPFRCYDAATTSNVYAAW